MLQPKAVFLQTINRCNAQCMICPYKDTYKNLPLEVMSLELFKKILADLSPNYMGQIGFYLHYEPLMDGRLFGLIKLAKELCPNSCISISTNALLLTDSIADELCKSPLDIITFNINGGTKATYEKMMPPLKWDTVINNIKNFLSKYRGRKYINFVKTMENHEEANLLKKIFPGVRVVSGYWATNRVGNTKISKPLGARTRFKSGHKSCSQLSKNLSITCDGSVLLCCNCWQKEVVLGNANDKNIIDIWNNSSLRHYNHSICMKCN